MAKKALSITLTVKDQELIDLLRSNARMSVTDIASTLKVSRSTAQKRLQRVEESGAIAGYTVRLSDAFEKNQIRAHVSVTLQAKKTPSVIAKMKKLRVVEEIHSVSGDYDLVVVLAADGVEALDAAIDSIIEFEGVERTSTSVILSTKWRR